MQFCQPLLLARSCTSERVDYQTCHVRGWSLHYSSECPSSLSLFFSSFCFSFSFFASAKSSSAAAFALATSISLSSAFRLSTSAPLLGFSSADDAPFDSKSATVLPFLWAFFAFLITFSTCLSCAEMSLVREVVRSNSSFAFASLLASFSSSSFSFAATTAGSSNQGSFFASSSRLRCSASLRFFSLTSSSFCFASRFFSNSAKPRFLSSSASMSLFSFACLAASAAASASSTFAKKRSLAVFTDEPSAHRLAALSHSFFAAAFTALVT
mmetsp:Transcript_5332/g.12835  ORF Transcript_5332/g.12835 Transcript_5332/m.12835 type:complete len:269 (+) Transcript_5332:25-831(+)